MPEMDVAVVVDRRPFQRSVEDGKLSERLDCCGGDEGHVGELDAVALFEGSPLALAQTHDARHVDFVDRVGVRDGALALGHALRDDGAHLGQGDDFIFERHLRGGQPRLRRHLRCDDSAFGGTCVGANGR